MGCFSDCCIPRIYRIYLILGVQTVNSRCRGRWRSRQCRDQTCSDPFLSFVTSSLCFSFISFSFVLLSHILAPSWIRGVCPEIFEFLTCTSAPDRDVIEKLCDFRFVFNDVTTLPPDWYERLESRWRMEGVDTVTTLTIYLFKLQADNKNWFRKAFRPDCYVKVSCFGAEFCVWSRPWPFGRGNSRRMASIV